MRAAYSLVVTVAAVVLGLAASGSLFASESDGRIETAAKNSYVFRTYLKDDEITIESKNGIVALTGTVADESHKTLAEDTVKGLPGVKHVDDRLQIKAPEAAPMSDDWISAKVKFALLFHRSVSASTQVHVKDGVVTLSGFADSQAAKDLATEYVKDVEGVKSVINKMTVTPVAKSEPTLGQEVDDASVTAQVKLTLLRNRSTSAVRTDVETDNGVVMLQGTARNQAEIDLVTKLVRDIPGVKDVKNQMKIGG